MTDASRCPDCGYVLPEESLGGLCANCLFGQAIDVPDDGDDPRLAATTPGSGGFLPPDVSELADLFPQVELLELIGQGGMGAVYKARQPRLDRFVALKIVKPDAADDPAFAERFTREARTLARLNHPNIVSVHDFGEVRTADGRPIYYFIMEYVDGANLRQLIETRALTAAQSLAVVPRLCDALHYAHEEGIVHRDIKPENILVDQRGRVKIADFGLAKLAAAATDYTLTGTHQVMGTPRYMAPEQMEGSHSVDHRADIYSLGVVFYEMLTGEVPMGQFVPPSQKVELDARLDEIVLRAMAREPERRFQHASEMLSSLASLSSDPSGITGPAAVDQWAGPSTILEQGVQRVLESAGSGGFRKLLWSPISPAVVALLLAIAGIGIVCTPWAAGNGDIYGYDFDQGAGMGLLLLGNVLALLARGFTRPAPTWRPTVTLLAGGLCLLCLWHLKATETHKVDVQSFEGGYIVAVGIAVALMLVGAWDYHGVSESRKKHPVAPRKRTDLAEMAQFGFVVPASESIDLQVISHFSRLGYRLQRRAPGEFVFHRGNDAGHWWADIRQAFMELNVRTGNQPDENQWVSCGWSISSTAAWGTDDEETRALLKREADGLRDLLGGEVPLEEADAEAEAETQLTPGEDFTGLFASVSIGRGEPRPKVAVAGSRFSKKAIVGACWGMLAAFAFVAIVVPYSTMSVRTGEEAAQAGPSSWLVVFFGSIAIVGAAAPVGTTLLGVMAISDIKASEGRLRGLGLAFADAIVFPLLLLDAIVLGCGGFVLSRMFDNILLSLCLMTPVVLVLDAVIVVAAWRNLTGSSGRTGGDAASRNGRRAFATTSMVCAGITLFLCLLLATVYQPEMGGQMDGSSRVVGALPVGGWVFSILIDESPAEKPSLLAAREPGSEHWSLRLPNFFLLMTAIGLGIVATLNRITGRGGLWVAAVILVLASYGAVHSGVASLVVYNASDRLVAPAVLMSATYGLLTLAATGVLVWDLMGQWFGGANASGE